MDNILDLRDIKRPKQTEILKQPETVPAVFSPAPIDSEVATRRLYTREQVEATRLVYLFERENGEIFSTSAIDAWNQMEYAKSQKLRYPRFLGTSDGSVRRKMTQEKGKYINAFKKKILALGSRSMSLNNEEGKLLGEIETPEIAARLEQIKNELEFVESEQKRVSDQLDLIEGEIFAAEIEDAMIHRGKVPNFSGGGDAKGIALYESGGIISKD